MVHVEQLWQQGDVQHLPENSAGHGQPPCPGRELTGVLLAFPVRIPLAFFLVMLKFFR